jgi:putative methyltransferase (TIGR04325 family)
VKLGRAARRFLQKLRGVELPPEWQCLPEGWRTSDPRVKGWNVESIVDTQRAKWPEAVRLARGTGPLPVHLWASDLSRPNAGASTVLMAYGYVLALAAWKKDRLILLDWGGGVGHYKLISQALLPHVEIEYHCKDVPLLCKAGRELQPSGRFHEDDESCFARDYDLVLASGSLEYVEDWKYVTRRLAEASRRYLYITRLPVVHRAGSFTVIQRPYRHGYVTEYVSWVLNRQEFLGHAGSLGLRLIREILLGTGPRIHGAPEQCEFIGFLFSRPEGRDAG